MSAPSRILAITSCVVKGNRTDFVNLYGLDDVNRIWQWDPVAAAWKPYKLEPRKRETGGGF